jgi:hypothetical protein
MGFAQCFLISICDTSTNVTSLGTLLPVTGGSFCISVCMSLYKYRIRWCSSVAAKHAVAVASGLLLCNAIVAVLCFPCNAAKWIAAARVPLHEVLLRAALIPIAQGNVYRAQLGTCSCCSQSASSSCGCINKHGTALLLQVLPEQPCCA